MNTAHSGDHLLVDKIDAIVVRTAGDGLVHVVYADWKGRAFLESARHEDWGWTFATRGNLRMPVDDVAEYAQFVGRLRRVSGPPHIG